MKLKDVLAKVLKGETLNDEERKLIEAHDDDATNRLINDKIAAERKKAEASASKAVDELNAKIAELTQELEQAKGGGSEAEKIKLTLEKAIKKAADLEQKLQSKDGEIKSMARKHTLAGIRSKLPLVDGIAPAVIDMAIETAFAGIEDLADEGTVAGALEKFKNENPRLISAGGSGAGTPPKGGAGASGTRFTMEQIKNMPPDEFLKNKDAIWAAEQKGEVK